MNVLISADKIGFRTTDKTILHDVSMQLHRNEILSIIGPNGAGKTSLLRILLGLNKPSEGTLKYHQPIRFGYMPQKFQINPLMPLSVEAFLRITKNSSPHLSEIFDTLNISHLFKSSMHDLSGGERQRVLLARALSHNPDVLALDEPAQGVDISGQSKLYELIEKIQKIQQCAVVMVSHDLHLVMAKTDTVICLNQHICCQGSPDSISGQQAFLDLFGETGSTAIAAYTHHHDHQHDLHGNIVKSDDEHKGCSHD